LHDQGHIPFRLRIGVTGHRKLEESAALSKAVSQGQLRIIVKANAGHRVEVDEKPPYKLAADAAKKRLEDDLTSLVEFNSNRHLEVDPSAARNMDSLAPAALSNVRGIREFRHHRRGRSPAHRGSQRMA
jgi:hypothetical protein